MAPDYNFEQIKVINRTAEPLEGCFDGRSYQFAPSYEYVRDAAGKIVLETVEDDDGVAHDVPKAKPIMEHGELRFTFCPKVAAERSKWQNRQMGTEDPEQPTDADYKLASVGLGDDDFSYLPPTDAVEAINRSMLDEDAQHAVVMKTKVGRRLMRKKSRRAKFTDPRLKNPLGLKADHAD